MMPRDHYSKQKKKKKNSKTPCQLNIPNAVYYKSLNGPQLPLATRMGRMALLTKRYQKKKKKTIKLNHARGKTFFKFPKINTKSLYVTFRIHPNSPRDTPETYTELICK